MLEMTGYEALVSRADISFRISRQQVTEHGNKGAVFYVPEPKEVSEDASASPPSELSVAEKDIISKWFPASECTSTFFYHYIKIICDRGQQNILEHYISNLESLQNRSSTSQLRGSDPSRIVYVHNQPSDPNYVDSGISINGHQFAPLLPPPPYSSSSRYPMQSSTSSQFNAGPISIIPAPPDLSNPKCRENRAQERQRPYGTFRNVMKKIFVDLPSKTNLYGSTSSSARSL
ncbi:hypothetical protein EYR41_006103 [Orbilia oligospora]|uniref:Uncharacterized protein n=1 Tax=Orbilia oligospora TaxID=2813651 RepID=A0A8H2E3I3_ORBOL|nr:hypothetical protein EYR41_006103 [Orbilia oligospora]